MVARSLAARSAGAAVLGLSLAVGSGLSSVLPASGPLPAQGAPDAVAISVVPAQQQPAPIREHLPAVGTAPAGAAVSPGDAGGQASSDGAAGVQPQSRPARPAGRSPPGSPAPAVHPGRSA